MQLVPLVFYDNDGKRHIVGEAVVKEDGSVQAQLNQSAAGAKMVRLLHANVSEFSIAPKR